MTINEFVSNVFEGVNVSTDDIGISRRWIYNEARPVRAELIKQELNKNRLFNGGQAQSLTYFKLEQADMGTYSILKSVNPIPKLIESDSGLAIDGIYTMSGKTITLTDRTTWLAKKNRRYARPSDSYAFIANGHLFIDGFADLDYLYVDVPGYFDDPVIVGILSENSCVEENAPPICKAAYDYEFFIPSHIERRVLEIVRSVVFRKLGIPIDTENNDKLDIQANVSNQVQSQPSRLP